MGLSLDILTGKSGKMIAGAKNITSAQGKQLEGCLNLFILQLYNFGQEIDSDDSNDQDDDDEQASRPGGD